MPRRIGSSAVMLVLCIVSLAGCSRSAAHTDAEIGGDPAQVTALGGPDQRHQIKLSADSAQRIGLQTSTMQIRAFTGRAPQLTVPLAAVLYDEDGTTWVYAETAQLTFQREPVVITRVNGDLAVLRSGPAPGTAVATVGAAELRGSEDGVPGE